MFNKKFRIWIAISVYLMFTFGSPKVHGQVLTAEILGMATDPSGASVPSAKITVVNLATGAIRFVTTDVSGAYTVPLLSPGRYSVHAEKSGFKSWATSTVTLAVGDKFRLNVRFELGSTTQQVSVVTTTPALQTQSATISTLVNSNAVENLPLNQRNFVQLAMLAGGAHAGLQNGISSGTRPDDRRNVSAVSINGMSDSSNNFIIDGMDDNEQIVGTIITKPSEEAISEFKVQTNNYSAQFSRTAGGVISIATKSGTNEFHGSAFEYFRNDALDAANFFLNTAHQPKAELRQNDWGGSLGGPIRKNKMFFFGDFEQLDLRSGTPFVNTVPTAGERNGIFTGVNPIFNPLTTTQNPLNGGSVRQEFPNDEIPASAISPVAQRLVDLYPLPNLPGVANNFVDAPTLSQRDDKIDARIDQQLNSHNGVFYRYSFQNTDTFKPAELPSINVPGIGTISPGGSTGNFAGTSWQRSQQAEVHLTHTFSPSLIGQVLFGFNRLSIHTVGPDYGKDVSQALGIPDVNFNTRTSGLATINIAGFRGLGDAQYLPLQDVNTDFQISPSVTDVRGSHTFEMGFSFIHRAAVQPSSSATRPVFSFNSLFTNDPSGMVQNSGNGLASFLLGYPASTIRNFYLIVPSFRTNEVGAYLQDNWRATPTLTLNLGVRYDVFTPWTERHNQLACVDSAARKILIVGQPGVSDHCNIPTDWSNFGPRFGVAKTFFHHLVLRGGYGISHWSPYVGDQWLLRNPPYATLTTIQTDNLTPINRIDQGIGLPLPGNPDNPQGGLAAANLQNPTPYGQQYNLTIEQEFLPGWVWNAAYVGLLGRKLLESYDLNQPLPGPGPVGPRRPFYSVWPNVSSITYPIDTDVSSYSALQASLEHRFSHGLMLLFNYTYSHAIDIVSTGTLGGGVGDAPFPVLRTDLSLSRGNSDFDVRHRGTLMISYNLPFGHGRVGFAQRLAQGWQVNSILQMQTGSPFSVTNSTPLSNTGGGDMPNRVCNGTLNNPAINKWFDTACFVAQQPFTIGDSGRGILRTPGFTEWDFSLFRNFQVRENVKLQLRGEFFNFLNNVNFGYPNSALGSPGFGVISNTGNNIPREIQLALHLFF